MEDLKASIQSKFDNSDDYKIKEKLNDEERINEKKEILKKCEDEINIV